MRWFTFLVVGCTCGLFGRWAGSDAAAAEEKALTYRHFRVAANFLPRPSTGTISDP